MKSRPFSHGLVSDFGFSYTIYRFRMQTFMSSKTSCIIVPSINNKIEKVYKQADSELILNFKVTH